MSYVTTVVLSWSVSEYPGMLDNVNAFFKAKETRGLTDLGEPMGGTKAPQVDIAGGAFNYLDEAAFIAHLEALPWRHRADVALFLNREHEMNLHPEPLWASHPATSMPEEHDE